MKKNNDKYYLYLIVTLGVIIGGVMLTGLISQLKPGKSTDVRARAATASTLKVTGVVTETDPGAGTFKITSAQFEDTGAKLAGEWTVTAPSTFQVSTLSPQMNVTVSVSAQQFNIQTKAITALAVKRR